MLDAIITSFVTFFLSARQWTLCIMHLTQSNCCSAKLSTSFLVSYDLITVQSLTPLTTRFRESYSSMGMSCK